MAAGLPDLVDCARLAEEAARLERVYELSELPRLNDVLAEAVGSVSAKFAFMTLPAGGLGAHVWVESQPVLTCQRCLQGFGHAVSSASDVEFAPAADAEIAQRQDDSEREVFALQDGCVSLRDLAEEELLLALPIAPACATPSTCGKAPRFGDAGPMRHERRPFSVLQDLLKKT